MCGGLFMLDTVFRKQINLAKLTHGEPSEESCASFNATCRNFSWSVAVVFCSVLVWEMSGTVLPFRALSFFKGEENRLMWSPHCLSVCLSILTYYTKTIINFILKDILWYWRPFYCSKIAFPTPRNGNISDVRFFVAESMSVFVEGTDGDKCWKDKTRCIDVMFFVKCEVTKRLPYYLVCSF